MKQKVVIKVSMDGHKSRSKAMKIAAGVSGVESVVLQGEDKNQLVVTGEGVDAVELTKLLRKKLGSAEVISVSSVEEEKKKEGGGGKKKADDQLSKVEPMVRLPLGDSGGPWEILLAARELFKKLVGTKEDDGESSRPKEENEDYEIQSCQKPPDGGESSKPQEENQDSKIQSCQEPDGGESSRPKEENEDYEIQSCQKPPDGGESSKPQEENQDSKIQSCQEPDGGESSKPQEENEDSKIQSYQKPDGGESMVKNRTSARRIRLQRRFSPLKNPDGGESSKPKEDEEDYEIQSCQKTPDGGESSEENEDCEIQDNGEKPPSMMLELVARKVFFHFMGLWRAASNADKVFFLIGLCFIPPLFLYVAMNDSAFMALFASLAGFGGIALGEILGTVLDPQMTLFSKNWYQVIGLLLVLFLGFLFKAVLDAAKKASIFQIIAGMALCLAIWAFAVAWKPFKVFEWNRKLKLFFYAMMKLPRPLCNFYSPRRSFHQSTDDDIDDTNHLRWVKVPQSIDLDEKESDEKEIEERAQRFIANFYDGLRLEREAELSKQPKAITSSDKEQKSDRSEIQLSPILDRQLFMEGLVLTELSPDAEEWDKAEQIHLMDKGLSNLPKEPKCPKLTLLFLQRNYKLRKISTSFFINMPLLEFLDLSDTGIMSLPKSLFELSRLKELYVKDCEFLMMLPPEIGKLKCLEVLDMEGTEIVNLPVEIKELAVLRCLRVSLYGCVDQEWKSRQAGELIPFGVISALSKLEDIYIYVNPDDERWGACVEGILNEVCGLTRLRILGFYFPRVELLSCLKWTGTSMIYQSLPMFKFIVGDHSKRIISSLPSSVEFELERVGRHNRFLKYINGEGVPEDIKKVLQYAATFHLDRHMTAKNLTEFGIENMEELQYCVLGECNEIQVIIDGNDVHCKDDNGEIVCESSGDRRIDGLESLQFMYIYNMKNLKSIWEGPVHKRCFSRLKSLTMSTCPQLTTIFTMGLLENLHKLEEITVRDCPAIKSLVSCEEGVKQSANYLPRLRTISLHYVPELVSISSEVCIFPKLEELSLYNCPKLKSLSIKEGSSEHLREITGEKDWWEALEWTQVNPNQFDGIFVPINDTCL